jgi:uncharacterized protein (TIGR02444 family)
MSMAEDAPDLETPFWAFSLSVYASDGVAEECLALQERLGLDVNLLLFAAYMGAVEGVRLAPKDIESANATVSDWHRDVVRPARDHRRALKAESEDIANPSRVAAAALREQVKAAELAAEKYEQARLWQWSRAHLQDLEHDGSALAGNLREALAFVGDADAPTPHLIEASIAYAAR